MKKLAFLILNLLFLSGCTALLWSGIDNKQVISETSHYVHFSDDNITSFGKVKSTEQIVMIGKNFLYVISEKDSKELMPLLMTKFPNAFQIESAQIKGRIQNDGKSFTSYFTLFYEPLNQQEITHLESLKFTKKANRYVKDYFIEGNLYKTVENLEKQYEFITPIPVSLDTYASSVDKVNVGVLLERVAMTPIALALDIIGLPIFALGAVASVVDGN